MAHVFLSYKREDAARVRKLVAALRGAGLDIWWDEDIPASAPWEATIEKALAEAKAVIVCWSPASVASENVRSEARVAREDGRLLQVFLKTCSPPLFFGERQGIDLRHWRGGPGEPQIEKIAAAARAIAAGRRVSGNPLQLAQPHRLRSRILGSVAAFIVVAGIALGWWLTNEARASAPQTLAVLPFRALDPSDANLVDAIWDDTRGAISKNRNLRVLGRQTVEKLAKEDLEPAEYRDKVHADYLLDGNVQHSGGRVLINVSVTRTADGAQIWTDKIATRLDDIFAVQSRIASEVEGRIRGRVAPGGGVVAKNIATSGEVYAIYADARAIAKKRSPDSYRAASALLRKALRIDPNYAPAWAELGFATWMTPRQLGTVRDMRADPVRYLRRALQLAPNLAHAHAVLAQVQYSAADSEAELRKAVALDPNDFEAWMWLGNVVGTQNRIADALAAHTQAVEIEPLFAPAVGNKIGDLILLGKTGDAAAEVQRIQTVGDPILLQRILFVYASANRKPGDALRLLLQARSSRPEDADRWDQRAPDLLQQLGFIDEAQALGHNPPAVAADYKGIPEPPSSLWGGWRDPAEIWLNFDAPALFGRILPRHGRLQEYVDHYRAAFKNADDFIASTDDDPVRLVKIAPTVAVVLRAGGEQMQSRQILSRTLPMLTTWLQNGPADPGLVANLAFFRGAQGLDNEAVSLLGRAVAAGWLPDNQYFAMDIADEPCFARLVGRADFQAIRRRILARIEQERAKVPLALLAQAYPAPARKAA